MKKLIEFGIWIALLCLIMLTIQVGVSSSMGSVRAVIVEENNELFLPLIRTVALSDHCLVEEDGAVVFEVESAPFTDNWVSETAIDGYFGASYYRWNGNDFFETPGNGVLAYVLDIGTAGTYRIRLRNRHDHPTPDLENDVFVRMDGGNWTKLFSPASGNSCGVGVWTWCSAFDLGDQNIEFNPRFYLDSGQHNFEISARSANIKLDRVVFFLDGVPASAADGPTSANCRIQ